MDASEIRFLSKRARIARSSSATKMCIREVERGQTGIQALVTTKTKTAPVTPRRPPVPEDLPPVVDVVGRRTWICR